MGVFLDVKKSVQRNLIAFSLTHLSDYQSNTANPAPVVGDLGKTCYRSDLDKLFQLQQDQTELGLQWVEVNYDFFFLDFDDHSQVQELPANHLIGTKAISVRVDEHFVFMDLMLVVSMFADTNFKKHDVVMDALFSAYLPTKSLPVYNQSTGSQSGSFLVGNGTEVLPMVKADQRPIQFLSVSLNTDRTVNLS